MTTYFTSDTHFFHENVIKYSNRPFDNSEEMNESLVERWNSTVHSRDVVYHLGDVSFGPVDRTINLLSRLNGKIHLVLGNHDRRFRKDSGLIKRFESVSDYKFLTINGQAIAMSHFPMISWQNAHYGSWMLHGHTHGALTYPFDGKIYDVGVDSNNYAPISFEELDALMISRGGHHDQRSKG